MVENSLKHNVEIIINPLLEEDFWRSDKITLDVDYCYGLISSGTIDLKKFSIEKTQEIIKYLVLSITKGEYVFPDTLTFLKELSQNLNKIRENSYYFEQDNLSFNNKFFQDNFILPLNYCVTSYISLIVHLNDIYNLENTDYLFEFNTDDENDIYTKTETQEEIAKWLQIFGYNIVIVRIENQFSVEKRDYKTLLNISHELNNNDFDTTFKNILKQKCDFLRYKWVIRRKRSGISVKYLKDGAFIEPKFEDSTNVFISKWKNDIDFHYSDGIASNDRFRVIYHSLKRKKLNELTLYELHQLIKYTKDFKKDYILLCQYVEEIKKRESSLSDSDYNRYIFAKDYNYALNNKFSFLISTKDASLETINHLYKYIKDFQESKEVKNFFVNYKYLKFIVEEIRKIDDNSSEDYLAVTQKLFLLGENIIDNYKSDIKWSERNLVFLYFFEYDKSLIKINDIPVFLQSNFQLPLSPTKYFKEFNEIKNEFLKFKGKYDVYEKINPQVQKVKELEKKDIRDLERLSLFTAVISFIIGGVSGFSFIKDTYTALIFFIIFSASLISFLIVLFIFTRGEKILKKRNIILIIVLYLFFGGSLLFLRYYFNNDYGKKIDNLESEIKKMKNNTTLQQQSGIN
ncbi:ABC transporter permease [Chryseobacterium proteolyticum]|uniref:hypothetical protein n=1 Tax=Chryseobacterium proteolyticum TaxID=118127 RepID=UPI0039831C83